jgi:hypothetical protein
MATENALSIIQGALEAIKVYAPGVSVTDADAERCLSEMNHMLDKWSNESLACFANAEQSFVLVPGISIYTIGTGGTIPLTRPLKITTGYGAAYLKDSNNNRYPIDVIEQDQWNQIGLLTNQTEMPDTLFYDAQYPLGIINIYGTPSAAYTVYFDSRLQLADLINLNVNFSLPPGYTDAIQNNLAVRIWKFFKQGTPDPELKQEAMESLASIKRTNIRTSPSQYDSAIVSKATSSYNIYNDSMGRGGS